MIVNAIPAVRDLLPGLLAPRRPSVACVCTTQSKYLVFDDDSSQPVCVVDFGEAARLRRVHHILSLLHPRLQGSVPRTLICATWRGGECVHIQEGLPGVPWFRVADACHSAGDWRTLLQRAADVLGQLHAATMQVEEWRGQVDVAAEIARQRRRVQASGLSLSPRVAERAAEWSVVFRAAPPLASVSQHGDFSLNNLLVAHDRLGIIDFDEFGATQMPLHDVFGLALSVALSQETRCPLSRAECIALCCKASAQSSSATRAQLPGLLLHHLLWRIAQCDGLPRRAALRRVLLTWLDEFVVAPECFLADLP